MKNAVIILILLISFTTTLKAQNRRPHKENGLVYIADRILTAYERANDSVNRRNEIHVLQDRSIVLTANLSDAKKQRHEIEKFQIGRTAQQKIEQERQNDIYTAKTQAALDETNTDLNQKRQIYNEVYGPI